MDIIIPIALELDWSTVENTVKDILEQHNNYGFAKFALACPDKGWRSEGYPPVERIQALAEMFLAVKNQLAEYGIVCGWWNTLTIKSGPSELFSGIVKSNGEKHPFGNCPLDENFKERFSKDIALFAKIADPAFIILEDDYSLKASDGCYCKKHLDEFAKRQGTYYSREEIVAAGEQTTPEALALLRQWRTLLKDSLVGLASSIRKELDVCSPHIPAGIMQSGGTDFDGNCVEEIARALAGENHTPFCRFFGAFYHSYSTKDIPCLLYHCLYNKQHIADDFIFYHETDSYPHTRFYTAAAHIKAIMATVYSYGFDGSTFQTQQILDCPNEEVVYGKMFSKERLRFNAVHNVAKQCCLKGAQVAYDPFYNTLANGVSQAEPLWLKCLSRFGIPYITKDSEIVFWDLRQAKYAEDGEIMKALSKTLFLDGDAAKILCQRGYGAFIGAQIGKDVAEGNRLVYDLGAREVISDQFAQKGKGRYMTSAHMYNPLGTGKMYEVIPTESGAEIISEFYDFKKQYISTSMLRFENSLGGKVVVMGLTLDNNKSHALYNYRRKRIFEKLLAWAECDFAFVKEAPEMFAIENRAKDPDVSGFQGMLTLINYCEDELDSVDIYLPEKMRAISRLCTLEQDGNWREIEFTRLEDGIRVYEKLSHLTPIYLLLA